MKVIIVLIAVMSAAMALPVEAADNKTPVVTNRDLDQYRRSNDPISWGSPSAESVLDMRSDQSRTIDAKDKMYWCSKGTRHFDRVSRARAKDEQAESELRGLDEDRSRKDHKSRLAAAAKKRAAAGKELQKAEKELKAMEDDAHRQGIPPGWIRCQF